VHCDTAGASLHIEVAGSPEIATVILVMSQPGSDMMLAEQPGPGAQFDLDVPETALGQQNVVVAGLDAEERLVAVSDTLNVDVTVPAALSSITVYPPSPTCSRAGQPRWRSPATTTTEWPETCRRNQA
jgi:hypothetical protein